MMERRSARRFPAQTPSPDRDPLCATIESYLRSIKSRGMLEERILDKVVVLCFGRCSADGLTRDIALVRLAKAMMDDPEYSAGLMKILRTSIAKS